MKYYKILNKEEYHIGFSYNIGLNIDPIPFNPTGSCQPGGIYFSDSEHICEFFRYGIWIREVTLPEDAKIYKDPEGNKYKADKVILKKRRSLKVVFTWKWMKEEGIKFTEDAINWASEIGNLEIVKFLLEQGVRPTQCAINYAAENGHLKIVKFLWEQGIRPSHYTIDWAAYNGYLNVVKFLVEQGYKPTCRMYNYAMRGGHSKVGQFLEKYI